jgi:hypothetical protein
MLQPECNEGPSASTATVTGLLQLAMNSSSHTAVEAAACHIPAQLEPEAARKLLTTAALRQHFSTVQHVAGLAVMRRHADAATLQSVLMDLVTRASTRDVWLNGDDDDGELQSLTDAHYAQYDIQRSLCVGAVCAMPAAAQLGADRLAQVLLAGVQSREAKNCIRRLCRLPAAHQLSRDQVADILDASIMKDGFCLTLLCRLPAANQLSADMVVQVLEKAIDEGKQHCVQELCGLAGAGHISSDMLLE